VETIRKPIFRVEYNGKNITADITRYLISVTYSDKVEGESDEIEIRLEDTDALWRGAWYPTKGDKMSLWIGYVEAQVFCGVFEIDEIELSGPPDTVSIRALATSIKSPLRTKNSTAFENLSLRQVAERVASKHGYSILGTIAPVRLLRVTQNRETDLGFLKRVAQEYGHVFSVRDKSLIFSSIFDLEKSNAVLEIDRTDLTRYRLLDKTSQTFDSAKVEYHNPANKQVTNYTTTDKVNADGVHYTEVTKGDMLNIKTKTETTQQAEVKAKSALWSANSKQQSVSLSLPGTAYLVSGNNFNLTGIGVVSGKYHITESSKRIDRGGGYVTELEAKRVGFIDRVKQKPKTPKKKNIEYRVVQ
jgi:phage protein D